MSLVWLGFSLLHPEAADQIGQAFCQTLEIVHSMRGTADGTVVVTRHAGNGFDVVLDVTGEVMLLFGRRGDFVKAAIHFGHRTTGRFEYAGNGGTVLLSSSAPDAPLNVIDIAVNNTAKTITLTVHASATTDISWSRGVYDLEMVSSDLEPVVTRLISGKVSVVDEVTT